MDQATQLTFKLNLDSKATFANFYPGNNQQLLMQLTTIASGRGAQYLFFWGKNGTGRTHLLQASCKHANKLKLPTFYLSCRNLHEMQPQVLENLEQMYLVCIDDIQHIAGITTWEEAYFDFFNRMFDAKKRLIIVGDAHPQYLGISLTDLTSRLASAAILQINELTDAEKIQALIFRAKKRGLILSPEVATFLWRRWPRDMHSLFAALDTLDQASLTAKHRLTIPFIKSVLTI